MKRKLLITAVIAILLSLSAFGTIAYYTARNESHNVITSGDIKIKLMQWADEERTIPFEGEMAGRIMPGEARTLIAEAKNTGGHPAFVRMKVTHSINPVTGEKGEADLFTLHLNEADWTRMGDGLYYYNKVLQPGETTAPIYDAVALNPKTGNRYQEAKMKIDVKVYAVQAENNGAGFTEAVGWPAE